MRVYQEYPANYVFYYSDPKGKHRTIFDTPVTKFTTRSGKEFQKEKRMHSGTQIWESDIKPVNRCLETNYLNADTPKLHTAFFDIESNFHPSRGFAPASDPFNNITAISVYLDWLDRLVTLALPPKTISWETALEICSKFEDCYIFEREEDMLDSFLNLIDDADVISGWNSETYDIPYTVGRIVRVLSKDDTRRLCLWDQYPKAREFERFGAKNITYDLIGRIHLDYMQLYRKYNYEERHSYSLDAIGEYELNEHKVPYEGTLDQLYNRDFEKFLEYNRQDTRLLAKLDRKLRFLDLVNTIAHDNTVLLPTTMGVVQTTEQAIINEAHSKGLVVPDRKGRDEDETHAAGAYVATPKKGMHEWIGAIDINSLYPSTIRALNMGPETIIGQLRQDHTEKYISDKMLAGETFSGAWEGLFGSLEYEAVMNGDNRLNLTIDWEADGTSSSVTANEVWNIIFNSGKPWILSANGTIFSYEKPGIIPGLLARWYSERKDLQKKLKEAQAAGNAEDIEYWDKRQLVKKINLNSLYGAILNPGCRFSDIRIGQSTTLTGRAIAKHMSATVNDIITGNADHRGESIIYGDSVTEDTKIKTDSGEITIKELFNQCQHHSIIEGKEYGTHSFAKVIGFNAFEDSPVMSEITYVMRHKTKKNIYEITLENGKIVKVTEDHSVMVDRDGFLIEVKPTEILDNDLIICLCHSKGDKIDVERTTVKSVVCIGEIDDYVYDISIDKQDPFFFGNDILLHNTDSVYFSAWPVVKSEVAAGTMPWDKETCIQVYDNIADQVNASFPGFMERAFHCPRSMGEIIRGGRELVASKGLFIKKKRYAAIIIDKEGKRLDVNGKPGKVKAMGLDLKRSDTPKVVQDFLSEILLDVLTGAQRDEIITKVREFKIKFQDKKPWEKGTPKRVNNLTNYTETEHVKGRASMPGHVRAAMNWNNLRRLHGDNHSLAIVDGMKTIVCKLKNNPMGYTSVGYPTDETRIPSWFRDLPFDDSLMEAGIVDQKVENLLGVLNWHITENTDIDSTFNSLFTFE